MPSQPRENVTKVPGGKRRDLIVHLLPESVYSDRFVEFVRERFPHQRHRFVVRGVEGVDALRGRPYIPNRIAQGISGTSWAARMSFGLRGADRVVIHSAGPGVMSMYLSARPRLARKSTWVVWGLDLHLLRRRAGEGARWDDRWLDWLGQAATGVTGDAELVLDLAQRDIPIKPVFYPNPIPESILDEAQARASRAAPPGRLRILVGNSADPSNCHLEAFELLAGFANEEIEVIVPLSYADNGHPEHIEKVKNAGSAMFGSKFKPLTGFMEPSQYADVLAGIDVAVFSHNRQQGLSTILGTAYLGKKVYTPRSNPSWPLLSPKIPVKATEDIDTTPFVEFASLTEREAEQMRAGVVAHFGPDAIAEMWAEIFDQAPSLRSSPSTSSVKVVSRSGR